MARVVHHRKAYQRLLTSPAMQQAVMEQAERIAEACGDGYVAELTDNPRNRARAAVITATGDAMRDNSANNPILHNL